MDKRPRLGSELFICIGNRISIKRLFLGVIFTTLMVSSANGQNTLALQEKCAEGAKKVENEKLNQPYPYGVSNPCVSFQNHYNKKLDKCFIRIGYYFGQQKGGDGLKHLSYGVGLYNVFESSNPIGELQALGFNVLRCYIGNNQCKSPDDFETSIKPYMEE